MVSPNLFMDMDGVLVHYEQIYENHFGYRQTKVDDNFDSKLVNCSDGFYADLLLMNDFELSRKVWQIISPPSLTGVSESPTTAKDKRSRFDKYISKH